MLDEQFLLDRSNVTKKKRIFSNIQYSNFTESQKTSIYLNYVDLIFAIINTLIFMILVIFQLFKYK